MNERVVSRAQDLKILEGIFTSAGKVLDVMDMKKPNGSAACAVCRRVSAAIFVTQSHPMLDGGGDVAA